MRRIKQVVLWQGSRNWNYVQLWNSAGTSARNFTRPSQHSMARLMRILNGDEWHKRIIAGTHILEIVFTRIQ